jgi:hypothetical protein
MTVLPDPRLAFLERINIQDTRIEFDGSHVVLLCGGKVPLKEHADADEPPIASLRHALKRQSESIEFFIPEEIDDWLHDGVFKDLMSFESELAAICSIVVIVLESAGAIAELGAFSQLKELSEKLIAIKSRDFDAVHNNKSFINLGLLRFLDEAKGSSVRSYPWDVLRPADVDRVVVTDVLTDIAEELGQLPKSAILNPQLSAHIAVIIYQLVFTFSALGEKEIQDYLLVFGVSANRTDIRRKLFLLERFQILKREKYSDAEFYVLGRYGFHKLRLASKDGKKIDAFRTNAECLEFYKLDTRQRNRHRAIARPAR